MSTTTKLLDAAEYRMRRGGYNAVSFRDIARDTNIKSSSVHYHYPKKEDLGRALVQRYKERFFKNLADGASGAQTPKQKLEAYRTAYRHALADDGAVCLCGLLGAELAGLPDILGEDVQAFFNANIEWVEEAMPDHFSESLKRTSAMGIVAGFQGAMIIAHSLGDISLFDKTTDQLIESCLRESALE